MPKICVNFKKNKDNSYKLYTDTGLVYADMPIAIMEMDAEYINPIVVMLDNIPTVVEKEEYEKTNKLFKLKIKEDSTLEEDVNGFEIYLPKDTQVKDLRFIDGQIVKINTSDESSPDKGSE